MAEVKKNEKRQKEMFYCQKRKQSNYSNNWNEKEEKTKKEWEEKDKKKERNGTQKRKKIRNEWRKEMK